MSHDYCPTNGKCEKPTIQLNINSLKINILDSYNLSITKNDFNTSAIVDNIVIEVRRKSSGNWMVLDNSNISVSKIAKASGFWVYRAKLNYNGETLTSEEVEQEVQYPTLSEIVSKVSPQLDALWQQTKNFVNPNNPNSGRREYGCWVYYLF